LNGFFLSSLFLSSATVAVAAQDRAAGETSFKKCLVCHEIGENAKNKVGPELNGLDGRKSGTAPDYNYLDANKKSGITWSQATFLEYIKDPRAKIPPDRERDARAKRDWRLGAVRSPGDL
jgi:cytochrome c